MTTIGLSRTIYEISGDFSRQTENFSHPRVLYAQAYGVPLELGLGTWSKETGMMWLPDRKRSFMISSTTWIQYTNVTDRQRTDTGRQQRPR